MKKFRNKNFKFQIVAFLVAAVVADASLGYYGGQYAWPGAVGYGFSSTCYGCRPFHAIGKRSAEPSPSFAYGPGVAGHPYGGTSYVGRTIWGLGKRSVEKREAEAEAEPQYGYFGGYGGYGNKLQF